ncbi:unnamed protein product [Prunus armeniaca]|uniref:Uncharacterized protein n=1 Tax=Prunus armeniaca TaxID=36596 RepID=A0A6J5WG68_PRUAR|nr:unnamed protein product [Prunus armeniaca]CAB4298632.1 unnamed protein product [Prunus armeniaca]
MGSQIYAQAQMIEPGSEAIQIIIAMGKMKTEEDGAASKVKSTGKDATKDGKTEKLSVSALLANMD